VLDVLSFLNMFLKVELKSKSANVKLIFVCQFPKKNPARNPCTSSTKMNFAISARVFTNICIFAGAWPQAHQARQAHYSSSTIRPYMPKYSHIRMPMPAAIVPKFCTFGLSSVQVA
jgi:hypothetical protein